MEYAPVIIPTLNRATHLKRCVISLSNNTGAEFTEVYISVDYPPSEKYQEGYNEVKKVLQTIDVSKFKKFEVIYQKENLGARKNTDFLQKLVEQKCGRYIYTEDDNEFAPNFLEYVNQGLELYEGNDSVLGVCGAKDTNWKTTNQEVAFAKLFPAYGCGVWSKKESWLSEEGEAFLLNPKNFSIRKMKGLSKRNRLLYCIYVCDVLCKNYGLYWEEDKLYWCDSLKSIYMHLSQAVCVVPMKAKSRTWGNDGTGVNMSATDINPEKEWPLDKRTVFEKKSFDDLKFDESNYKLGNVYLNSISNRKYYIKAILLYTLLLLCGKQRNRLIKVLDCLNINNN